MKLLIVTSVSEFQKEILSLFKKASIEVFSRTEIDGFKNASSVIATDNWFAGEKSGNESLMLFSFTEPDKIDSFFELVQEFNSKLETNNPIRVVVVDIERYI